MSSPFKSSSLVYILSIFFFSKRRPLAQRAPPHLSSKEETISTFMSSPCLLAVHSAGAVALRTTGHIVSRPRPRARARSTAANALVRDTLTLHASRRLAVDGAITDADDDTSATKQPRSAKTTIAAVTSLESLAALSYAAPSDAAAEVLPSIVASFNLATFSP